MTGQLFKKCEHKECTTMIGWQVGALQGQTECKWCQLGVSRWQIARQAAQNSAQSQAGQAEPRKWELWE
jgi:hypothetical protein